MDLIGVRCSLKAKTQEAATIKKEADHFMVHEILQGMTSCFKPLIDLKRYEEAKRLYEKLPQNGTKEKRMDIYDKVAYFPFKKLKTIDGNLVEEDSTKDIYLFTLIKKNLNTRDAVSLLAKHLGVSINSIQFSGTKDKRAVTFQEVSVNCDFKKLFELAWNLSKNPEIYNESYGYTKEIKEQNEKVYNEISQYFIPANAALSDRMAICNIRKGHSIRMGIHESNKFVITVCDIQSKVAEPRYFINYYGPQRFGMYANNHIIGGYILQKKYKEAVDEILRYTNEEKKLSRLEHYIKTSLEKGLSHESIVKKIDRLSLMMYMHAYQSFEFNSAVNERIEAQKFFDGDKILVSGKFVDPEDTSTPLTDIYIPLQKAASKFLKGGYRKLIEEVFDFSMKLTDQGLCLAFTLSKSSYATIALSEILQVSEVKIGEYEGHEE